MKEILTLLIIVTCFAYQADAKEPLAMLKMNLNQITLPSTDIEKSATFYQAMGFEKIVSTSDYARFESSLGEATFSLHVVDKVHEGEGVVVYFEVATVSEVVAALKTKGFVFERETIEQDWLWTEAYLRDPSGNLICIYNAGKNRKNPPWRLQ